MADLVRNLEDAGDELAATLHALILALASAVHSWRQLGGVQVLATVTRAWHLPSLYLCPVRGWDRAARFLCMVWCLVCAGNVFEMVLVFLSCSVSCSCLFCARCDARGLGASSHQVAMYSSLVPEYKKSGEKVLWLSAIRSVMTR